MPQNYKTEVVQAYIDARDVWRRRREKSKRREEQCNALSFAQKVQKIFEQHNPAKLAEVPQLLERYSGREDELLRRLQAKYEAASAPLTALPPLAKQRVYLDFAENGEALGRVVIALFDDKVPLATENFRALCVGAKVQLIGYFFLLTTVQSKNGATLTFANSHIHRIVPGFIVQGGDITAGDGTGGTSIYAGSASGDMWGNFRDEHFYPHDREGLVSMANNGPNRNK